MKKYLITAALAVAISGAFVSCSDDIASDSLIEQKAKTFNDIFIEAFGTPVPNHTWGFNTNVTPTTRGEYADANLWYLTYNIPPNVTANEKKLVTDYFTNNLFENKRRINNVNFTNFFVYQVYKGEEVYTAHNGGSVLGSNHMDHLQTYVGGTMEEYDASTVTEQTEYYGNGRTDTKGDLRREHMNNFNSGDNQNVVYWDKKPQTDEYKIVGAMLMVNSGTADFSYHGSEDSQYHNTYVIIPGETIDPSLKGFWYVGFDFFENGQNSNQQVDRDWQFNDWIVRISPAEMIGGDEDYDIIEHEEVIEAGRVFCEDLGASSLKDLDYNDIVFDGIIVHGWKSIDGKTIDDYYYAQVCLLAAGGTIPASVADVQVHNQFGGIGTVVMINTTEDNSVVNGAAIAKHAPVVIKDSDGNEKKFYGISNLNDLKIAVVYNNKIKEITNEENLAPYKICVPIGTRWAKERVNIGSAYKDFSEYCNTDPTIKFWEGRGVSDDDLWDDHDTPSPFEKYHKGYEIKHKVTHVTPNSNNGSDNSGNNDNGDNNDNGNGGNDDNGNGGNDENNNTGGENTNNEIVIINSPVDVDYWVLPTQQSLAKSYVNRLTPGVSKIKITLSPTKDNWNYFQMLSNNYWIISQIKGDNGGRYSSYGKDSEFTITVTIDDNIYSALETTVKNDYYYVGMMFLQGADIRCTYLSFIP